MRLLIAATAALVAVATASSAAVIGVAGGNSSAGTAPAIIAAPTLLQNSNVFNTGQEGFNELQSVLLGGAVATDQGSLAAGLVVDSHMIFLNKQDQVSGTLSHTNVTWTFSGVILGVMSDSGGFLEAASTPVLGLPGSTYGAPFPARGMEGADVYSFFGNQLTVDMLVTQPGDWIRVVTAVPVPAAMPLLLAGLGGLGFAARRKKREAA